MGTSRKVLLAFTLFAAGAPVRAEVVNVTNSAEGANREAGLAAVKAKLSAACTERGGKPDPASFEVVFERNAPNPNVPKPYYVDGKMRCELP